MWHDLGWQGSGKSLTMLFAAVKLRREEKKLRNPVILVVTDRIDLDDQISGTFRNLQLSKSNTDQGDEGHSQEAL